MSDRLSVGWRGLRRSLVRVAALFAVTAGGYWPVWITQVLPALQGGARQTRTRAAVALANLIPGLNLVFEVLLAVYLPRTLRRRAQARPSTPAPATEAQTFLLLAAPFAAIAITLALSLPAWLIGYIAWPLELPAALLVQGALNRLVADEVPATPPASRGVDGEVLASGLMAAGIVIAVVLVLALGGDGEKSTQAAPSQTPQASDLAVTPGALWVTRIADNAVARYDPATGRPTGKRIPVGRSPYDIAFGFGDLWVADYMSDGVSRVDPKAGAARGAPIRTGRGPFGVAVGEGSVWVTDQVDRNVVQIDPKSGTVRRRVQLGRANPRGVDVGAGAVWVAGGQLAKVFRVDPRTGGVRRITVPSLCQDVAVGGGSVWAALPELNAVVRIDPTITRVEGKSIQVGLGPASIDYGAGKIWVANGGDGTVSRIDARTGRMLGSPQRVGGQPTDITVSGRDVWVLRADGTVRHLRAD